MTNLIMKTLRFHLQALPPDTPPNTDIYLAGNMNHWNPSDGNYRFKRQKDGSLMLEFHSSLPDIEFKLTRGDWSSCEGGQMGAERPNRRVNPGFPVNDFWLRVDSWTDHKPDHDTNTLPDNVVLLESALYSPQLGRSRRIWACLPPDYHTSGSRYPVVYMHDGQNLFDNPEAVFGSWGIDQALNRIFMRKEQGAAGKSDFGTQPIFIAIENAGEHRITEYSPWTNPRYGGGGGNDYLRFIRDTLKPLVDARLRTLPERRHTGIMGSSMGGLISLYAAIEHADVFGMAGIFSPSLWFSPDILDYVRHKTPRLPVKILLMAGQQESKTMVSDLLDLYEALLEAGHADENLHYDLHADGVHSEWFWAREFEHALHWLFEGKHEHEHGVSGDWIKFRVDEGDKDLVVSLHQKLKKPVLQVHDYCCDRQFDHPLTAEDTRIPFAAWETCLYSIRVLSEGNLVFSRRVHLNQLEKMSPLDV